MKEETLFFGDTNVFSIVIKPKGKNFLLRVWIQGVPIGDFRQPGTFDYLVNSYFKFLKEKDNMYDEGLLKEPSEVIYQQVVFGLLDESISQEDLDKASKRMDLFAFSLGNYQFNQYGFLMLHDIINREVRIVVSEMPGDGTSKYHSFTIATAIIETVWKEAVRFCYINNLKRHQPFFLYGFSEEDLR